MSVRNAEKGRTSGSPLASKLGRDEDVAGPAAAAAAAVSSVKLVGSPGCSAPHVLLSCLSTDHTPLPTRFPFAFAFAAVLCTARTAFHPPATLESNDIETCARIIERKWKRLFLNTQDCATEIAVGRRWLFLGGFVVV